MNGVLRRLCSAAAAVCPAYQRARENHSAEQIPWSHFEERTASVMRTEFSYVFSVMGNAQQHGAKEFEQESTARSEGGAAQQQHLASHFSKRSHVVLSA